MRVFIAIEIPAEVRRRLADAQQRLRGAGDIKWVDPANIHLTLRFLGETDQGTVSRVANALGAVAAAFPAFSVEIAGAGVFPDERRPRVVWVGVRDGLEPLFGVAQHVESVCQSCGFEAESRPFTAHVTLGRVRVSSPLPGLIGALRALESERFGHVPVNAITVMESTLKPSGPTYRPLHRLAFHAGL